MKREQSDWPRERLEAMGADQLLDVELLALLIGTGARGESVLGLAQRILDQHGGLCGLIHDAPQLARCPGIGSAKAGRIRAAFEIGRRAQCAEQPRRHAIRCARDVYELYGAALTRLEHETAEVLLLDIRHRVRRHVPIGRGTVESILIHPRQVFAPALTAGASGVILIHNHPSGDPTPSQHDRALTTALVAAGHALSIPLLDHVVVGQDGFTSLSENRQLFDSGGAGESHGTTSALLEFRRPLTGTR